MKKLLYYIIPVVLLYSCQSNQTSSEKTTDSLSAPVVGKTTFVAQDSTSGERKDSVLVILDREKIVQRGLTGGAVIDVLTKEEEHLKTVEDYEKVIAGVRGKDTIYLKDVATFKVIKE